MTLASLFLRDQHIHSPSHLIETPLVSIIMPVYCRNASGKLARAIDSIRAQTFENWECIIVDDGSTDGTADTIRAYQQIDNRFIHIRHEWNCGLPAIRVNEGLMLARGTYIAYQFDDDIWMPKMLHSLLKKIGSMTDPCLVYGKSQAFPPDNRIIGEAFQAGSSRLMDSNFIANNAVLHTKSCFERFGGYDCHVVMKRVCDWLLWQRWAQQLPFAFLDRMLTKVSVGASGAVGLTAPYNMLTNRIFNGLNRGEKLRPEQWLHQHVDEIASWTSAYSPSLSDRVVNEHIKPWQEQISASIQALQEMAPYESTIDSERVRDNLVDVPLFLKKRSLLVSKMHYDPSVDITFQHFNTIKNPLFHSFFVPLHQLERTYMEDPSLIVLHRACYDFSVLQHHAAQRINKPVAYVMDDDFLYLHEVSPEFHYLAPGSDYYKQLVIHLQEADTAIAYSDITADSIRPHNPRVITLSTNIPSRFIKDRYPHPNAGEPFRIGYTGGNSRTKEFQQLWAAFQQFSAKYKDQVEFIFWGMNPHPHGQLQSPLHYVPFTYSYYEYMNRLEHTRFDVAVAPLDDETRAKAGKCPIKYLEYTAAGTLGIYSEAQPYRHVQHRITGWKVKNTVEAWLEALEEAFHTSMEKREQMWQAAKQDVWKHFSTEKERIHVAAAAEATILHHHYRTIRHSDGKPRIAFVWNDAQLGEQWDHWFIAMIGALRTFHFEPVIIALAGSSQLTRLTDWCRQYYIPIIPCPARTIHSLSTSSVSSLIGHTIMGIIAQSEYAPAGAISRKRILERFQWANQQWDPIYQEHVQTMSLTWACLSALNQLTH